MKIFDVIFVVAVVFGMLLLIIPGIGIIIGLLGKLL